MYYNRLKEIAKAKGKSLYRVSMQTGIAPCTIYQIANGKIYPFEGWRQKIASVLKESEADIFPCQCEGEEAVNV
ncbi:hypothetical protein [Lutispora sp.]|uniref:hypothetical protein n=1 Tax=Lutispora sp. TaxID=2828727 RepID=UPI003568B4D9